MITHETAKKIAYAYAEIEAAEKLLTILEEAEKRCAEPDFRDSFGYRHGRLQLGVPDGPTGQRLYNVAPGLGKIVITAHIAAKRQELEELWQAELARANVEASA